MTRKITRGLSRIQKGLEKTLFIGTLNSLRDWGHAKDYIKMQWLMLQQKKPKDYVIATGKQISVREFINFSAEFFINNCSSFRERFIYKPKTIFESIFFCISLEPP